MKSHRAFSSCRALESSLHHHCSVIGPPGRVPARPPLGTPLQVNLERTVFESESALLGGGVTLVEALGLR